MKRRWERPAWPLPPLWKADGLRPDRHGLTDIRVLRVPRATQKNAGHPPKRKTSECGKKKAPIFPPSETSARTPALSISHTERAPAVVGPPPCKSPASRRGASAPRLPPTFSGLASQWLTFVTQLSLLRCILAPTVPFAWGFVPRSFQNCRLTTFGRCGDSHTASSDQYLLVGPPAHCQAL